MLVRLLSALVAAPIVLGMVLWPGGDAPFRGWPLALLVLLLTVGAMWELYHGCRQAGLLPREGVGYAAALLFLLAATPLLRGAADVTLQFGLTLLLTGSLAWEALRRDRAPLKALPATWFGAFYIGWLFPYLLRLRLLPLTPLTGLPDWMAAMGEGAWLLLWVLVTTSSTDTGAYLVGKRWGRHKLAPEVSPGKTWEGAVGGFIASVLVAWGLGALLGLPTAFALAGGALTGVVSQLGDLSKSAIKREIGVKDFGTLMPGHGGILDRFDSLLFAAPAIYWLTQLWQR
ncbi:MAG: phosphatidate cytidylyltransferase [Armatimonadota bacterium]